MDVVVAATVTGCYHGQSAGLRLYENNNKCAFPLQLSSLRSLFQFDREGTEGFSLDLAGFGLAESLPSVCMG